MQMTINIELNSRLCHDDIGDSTAICAAISQALNDERQGWITPPWRSAILDPQGNTVGYAEVTE